MRKIKTGIVTLTVASSLLVGGALANAATPMKEEPMPSKKAEILLKEERAAAIVTDTFHAVEKNNDKQILMIGVGVNAADIVLAKDAVILINGEKADISSLVADNPVTVVQNMAGEAFLVIQVIHTADNAQSTEESASQGNTTPDVSSTSTTDPAATNAGKTAAGSSAADTTNSTPAAGTEHIH